MEWLGGRVEAVDLGIEIGTMAVLLVGLTVAAVLDWRTREVPDRLWQILAIVGALGGAVLVARDGLLALLLWGLVAAFVLEHLVPWDAALERVHDSLPGWIEAGIYIVVALVVAGTAWARGIGPAGVPPPVLAVFASVLLSRGLFEVGLLYGGADAKALIVAGTLVPIQVGTVLTLPPTASGILSIYPFALTVLMNAALASVSIPIAIAVRNVRSREFSFPRGFTGFMIPVSELPNRFVWLKDPSFARGDDEEREAETSEDDRKLRERQSADLRARGVSRIWVTPQIPFIILIMVGAILGAAFGNVVIDLLAAL